MGGAVAGQVKSGGGLTFLAVEGAGHMVPMDQPANVRTPIIGAIEMGYYFYVFGVLIDYDYHNSNMFQSYDAHY